MATCNSRGVTAPHQNLTAITLLVLALIATALSAPLAPMMIGSIAALTLWQPNGDTVNALPNTTLTPAGRGVLLVISTNTGRITTRWVPA